MRVNLATTIRENNPKWPTTNTNQHLSLVNAGSLCWGQKETQVANHTRSKWEAKTKRRVGRVGRAESPRGFRRLWGSRVQLLHGLLELRPLQAARALDLLGWVLDA